MTPLLWQEELKNLLMKMKEESEKVGLKPNIQKTKIMACGPITSWQMDGETVEKMTGFIFWAPKSLQLWNYKMFAHWKKSYDQPRQHIKKQSHYFANKFHLVKAMLLFFVFCFFFSSHIWMQKLEYKESWVPKNWWFWIVMLDKTLESPLDIKEVQPKGN